jgi:DNA-directed RNA polymerase specialized sigma24 family protein
MRSEWEALHRGLVRSIVTKEAEQRFEGLRGCIAGLTRFGEPSALIEYLAHPGGDLDEKDRILADLVLAASVPLTASVATALLLLGLWPGLDAAFRRRAPLCQDQAGDLAAEIVARFTDQVRRLDLRQVHRVAATLVRNTERDVLRARIRELRRRRLTSPLPIEVAEGLVAAAWAFEDMPSAAQAAADHIPRVSGTSPDGEIAAMRSWLADLVGRDADLVVDALLLNRSRFDLGAERGINEQAARKRLQRALGRIRRCLEQQIPGSRDGGEVAFARP